MQRIFEECCKAEADKLLSEFNGRNGQALRTLVQQHNVQLRRFPNDFLTAYGTAAGEVLQEMLDDKDQLTREVAQSYLKARRELMAWNRIAEQGYMNARLLDYKFPG